MGDRANVVIPQEVGEDSNVYLYTHWAGTELPATVQTALARRERWDDQQYLTRIIFEEMIKPALGHPTGYGITAWLGDGATRLVYVDTAKQQVRLQRCDHKGVPRGEPQVYSFDEYVALPEPQWPEAA